MNAPYRVAQISTVGIFQVDIVDIEPPIDWTKATTGLDEEAIFVAAQTGENIPALRARLSAMITEQYKVRYPYQSQKW